MGDYRIERDSMGEMKVPADRYWGAQTQRSYQNFKIGTERMPLEIIHAFGVLKRAAAMANHRLGRLDDARFQAVCAACDEVTAHKLDDHFPLVVWQTGSGTQSNMNVNEVVANRGNELAGERLLHPNDHVNMSQSSNDTFPTALHIAAATAITQDLLPAIDQLVATLRQLEERSAGIVKCGRTHLQDAVPIAFSQEVSGWRGLLEDSREQLEATLPGLYRLALGGTAVGTGLNAPAGFDTSVAAEVARLTGMPFVSAPNKFAALSGKDAVAFAHGAVRTLAANMMKIANDVRWLASGPRDGLGEITIPANEPGSSIMPGKVNPTQCEAVTMVAVQVMGNDAAIGFAASQGNFQLNVFLPVTIYNFLQSVRLLGDAMESFRIHCALGIKANKAKMKENLHRSLMLVTALTPYIGYEKAAEVAKLAHKKDLSLKEAILELDYMTETDFDAHFHPEKMV